MTGVLTLEERLVEVETDLERALSWGLFVPRAEFNHLGNALKYFNKAETSITALQDEGLEIPAYVLEQMKTAKRQLYFPGNLDSALMNARISTRPICVDGEDNILNYTLVVINTLFYLNYAVACARQGGSEISHKEYNGILERALLNAVPNALKWAGRYKDFGWKERGMEQLERARNYLDIAEQKGIVLPEDMTAKFEELNHAYSASSS